MTGERAGDRGRDQAREGGGGEAERQDVARRWAEAGRRYRELRAIERRYEAEGRAINYFILGLVVRLLPGQRYSIPLPNGDTLTLCGET
jgi:hypothetical protein